MLHGPFCVLPPDDGWARPEQVLLPMPPKPIIRWPGGKTRLLKQVLPLIRPHQTFVEAFAGGIAVLLAKEPSKAEVINDINSDLVNLYRHAQFHLEALIQEIEWTLNSRENLADLRAQPGLTGLQRAARFFLRNRMSFGGGGQSYAVSVQAQPSRANVLETLRTWSARLDKVSVENLPYERLFDSYDRPTTLWFLDPPYSSGETKNYDVWSQATMAAFAERVQSLEGDWIVTINDSPENRALFAAHDVTPLVTRSQVGNQRLDSAKSFGELVIRRRLAKPRGARKAVLSPS